MKQNFKNLEKLFSLAFLLAIVVMKAQTINPALEMATGAGNPTGNGPVATTTINFQENTNNPTGTTFSAYTPALSATYTVSNTQFGVNDILAIGRNGNTTSSTAGSSFAAPIFDLMNSQGGAADANFTSTGVANGTGISASTNRAVRMYVYTYPLRVNARATNATHQMADLTVTFNRAVNNPVIHLGALGAATGAGLGYSGRFEIVSSNVALSALSLTRLSGNNTTSFQASGLAIFNGATSMTASGTGSGSGSVRINGVAITSLTFRVSIRGGDTSAQATTRWASSNSDTGTGEAFTMGFSVAESDLQVTQTVSQATAVPGNNVVFTITARNNGASNNTGVNVAALLPSGYEYVSSTVPAGTTYNTTTGVWNIPTLNDTGSSILTITARVKPTGVYNNTVSISSAIGDPVSTNNSASASINLDTDGDGVIDSVDLDDDNDGILDTDEGLCASTSIPEIDGFDSPVVANTNGNNFPNQNPYNGWTAEAPLGQNAFNIIRVNGTAYGSGADNAQSGNQYVDINGAEGYLYKDIIVSTASVFSGSAWFSNRETANSGFTPKPTRIELYRVASGGATTLVAQGNEVSLTKAMGDEGWYESSITGIALIAGTYRVRVFVGDWQHVDSISYCFSTDTDGDGIPNHLDLDSDNDGCFDAIESSGMLAYSQAPTGVIEGPVGTNGVKTAAGSGFDIGTSQDATLNKCNDFDLDGVPNNIDLDDDNDGILDTAEEVCTTKSLEGSPVFKNDFGTGSATGTDANVVGHNYVAVSPSDGNYTVTTSLAQSLFYTQTNLIGHLDAGYVSAANGSTNGRFLMININSAVTTASPIYRVANLTVVPNTPYRFRIDIAGLAEGSGNLPPNLRLSIKDGGANGNIIFNNSLTTANDDVWRRLTLDFTPTVSTITIEIYNLQTTGSGNDVGIDNIVLAPLFCDNDNDGIPNHLDTDSDGDGCPDAIEGSENVKYTQVHALTLPSTDPDYLYRGQIKVGADGINAGSPSGIISNDPTIPAGRGVPRLVNNAAGNPGGIGAGVADNTDGTPDIGQDVGNSQNNTLNDCKCYKSAATTGGANVPTAHGITAFNRAGADNSNWPMVRNNGWTALEANTKALVINRMPSATATNGTVVIMGEPVTSAGAAIFTNPIIGMTFYDTTRDCLKINTDGTRTGWKCFNAQSCPDEN